MCGLPTAVLKPLYRRLYCYAFAQERVNKNMKQSQARKAKGRPDISNDEGAVAAAAAPRRWTDYTVR